MDAVLNVTTSTQYELTNPRIESNLTEAVINMHVDIDITFVNR